MACLEMICEDFRCGWSAFSNNQLEKCPTCGGPIQVYMDEETRRDLQEGVYYEEEAEE